MSAPGPKAEGAGAGSAPAAAAVAAPAAAAPGSPLLKPSSPWTCLVLGGSGATGRVLVSKLANNPRVTRISALVRKELPVEYFDVQPANAGKIHQTVVDFEKLDESAPAFQGHDVAFSCLGSTASKAGSKAKFFHYDFDYITHAARLSKNANIRHFSLMSTGGANPKSMFHYLKTKGQIEEYIRDQVRFQSYSIFRPGLLMTERPGESRWGEWIAQKVLPVFHPILPEKHKAVFTQTVAEAMMVNAEFVLASMEKKAAEGQREGAAAAEPAAAAAAAVQAEGAPAEGAPAPAVPTITHIYENDDIRLLRVAKV